MSMNESTAPRLMLPALSGLYEALAPYSYSFMRFWVGAIMVPHGYVKLFNGGITNTAGVLAKAGFEPSFAWAYLVSGVEFFAAVFVAIGFLTRPAALLLAIELFVITFVFQWGNGYFWTGRGYEYALLWACLYLAIAVRGGDRLSVDRAIGREI